jgi:hypothetical protein
MMGKARRAFRILNLIINAVEAMSTISEGSRRDLAAPSSVLTQFPLWPAYYRQRGPVLGGLDHQYFQI